MRESRLRGEVAHNGYNERNLTRDSTRPDEACLSSRSWRWRSCCPAGQSRRYASLNNENESIN